VQALIAARLDTLPPDRKSLLHDAAVVGKVFWSGTLASMGGRGERDVREGLHELARKELVRPARRSSVEGQAEYSFWHLLIRDVAYAQIPRAARADKHRAVAEWIEDMAGERVSDHAELLAFHHEEAIRLKEATGAEVSRAERQAAARFLELAAEKMESLDLPRAMDYLERALGYLADDPQARTKVLTKLSEVGLGAGRLDEAIAAGREAVELASAAGDRVAQGAATALLADAVHAKGEGTESRRLGAESVALLEQEPPGPELVRAYAQHIGGLMLEDRNDEVLQVADRAIELARSLNQDRSLLMLTQIRGVSKVKNGDRGGLEDIEAALRLGLDRGFGQVTMVTYINYADSVWFNEGPDRALEIHRTGQEFGARRGVAGFVTWSRGETLWMLFDLGRWDEVLERSERLIEEGGRTQMGIMASSFRAFVLVRRGQASDAAELLDAFLPLAREARDPQVLSPALLIASEIRLKGGNREGAAELLSELDNRTRAQPFWTLLYLADIARAAVTAGDPGPAMRLMSAASGGPARHSHGLLAARATLSEAEGDLEEAARLYAEAAAAWESYGGAVEQAMANLGAGRALAGLGRVAEADGPLRAAAKTFSTIGAIPALAEAQALLAGGTAVGS